MIAVDFSVDDMNQCYSTMKCQMEFHPITMKPMLQTVNAIVLIDITGLQSVQWVSILIYTRDALMLVDFTKCSNQCRCVLDH